MGEFTAFLPNSVQLKSFITKSCLQYNLQEPQTGTDDPNCRIEQNNITPFAYGSERWLGYCCCSCCSWSDILRQQRVCRKNSHRRNQFYQLGFVKSVQIMKDLIPLFPEILYGLRHGRNADLVYDGTSRDVHVMGDWEIAVLRKENPNLELDCFPIPSATGGKPTVSTWVDASYAVNANSEK